MCERRLCVYVPVVYLHSHLRKYSAILQVVFHVARTQINLATTKSKKVLRRDVNSQHSALFSLNESLLLPTQHFMQCVIRASNMSVINSSNKKLLGIKED